MAVAGLIAIGSDVACAQILRWEIEAIVVGFHDPHMVLPEMRPADPVRGFLSFDL
jgi:hypothetical protein